MLFVNLVIFGLPALLCGAGAWKLSATFVSGLDASPRESGGRFSPDDPRKMFHVSPVTGEATSESSPDDPAVMWEDGSDAARRRGR